MKKWISGLTATVVIVGIVWFYYHSTEKPLSNSTPEVLVQVVEAKLDSISLSVTAYGSAVVKPGGTTVVSVPYEAKVEKIIVSPGERVLAGATLLTISPSSSTKLALVQAKSKLSATQQNLLQIERLFKQHLATNVDLSQSRQAEQSAQAVVESLRQSGAVSTLQLPTPKTGIISAITLQEGQVAPAGTNLVTIVPLAEVEAKLGVEPEDSVQLKVGQKVSLSDVHSNELPVQGRIRLIAERVDLQTRLADVYVSLPDNAKFMLNSFLSAEVKLASKSTLVVPQEALLLEGSERILFTVKDNHAIKQKVAVGLENNKKAEITGDQIKPGELVVVTGASELSNGMAVKIENKS